MELERRADRADRRSLRAHDHRRPAAGPGVHRSTSFHRRGSSRKEAAIEKAAWNPRARQVSSQGALQMQRMRDAGKKPWNADLPEHYRFEGRRGIERHATHVATWCPNLLSMVWLPCAPSPGGPKKKVLAPPPGNFGHCGAGKRPEQPRDHAGDAQAELEVSAESSPSIEGHEGHEIPDQNILDGLAGVLGALAEMNQSGQSTIPSSFISVKAAPVSISAYLRHFGAHSGCSTECYVMALVYLDRCTKKCSYLAISDLSCHRMLGCALVIAAKMQDDVYYSNKFYSNLLGFHIEDMNDMELEMLKLLNFRLYVGPEEFKQYEALVLGRF